MYSRSEIEAARRDVASGKPRTLTLDSVPVDAEYRGKGPLYVWNGQAWLDYDLWFASADLRGPEGGGGERENSGEELPTPPPPKKKSQAKSMPLLDSLEDDQIA